MDTVSTGHRPIQQSDVRLGGVVGLIHAPMVKPLPIRHSMLMMLEPKHVPIANRVADVEGVTRITGTEGYSPMAVLALFCSWHPRHFLLPATN